MTEQNEQPVTVRNANTTFEDGNERHTLRFNQSADFGNTHVALNTETLAALVYVDNGDRRQFTDGDKGAASGGRNPGGSILTNGQPENTRRFFDRTAQVGDKFGYIEDLITGAVRDAFADGVVTVAEQHGLTDLAVQLVNQKNPSKEPRER